MLLSWRSFFNRTFDNALSFTGLIVISTVFLLLLLMARIAIQNQVELSKKKYFPADRRRKETQMTADKYRKSFTVSHNGNTEFHRGRNTV